MRRPYILKVERQYQKSQLLVCGAPMMMHFLISGGTSLLAFQPLSLNMHRSNLLIILQNNELLANYAE